MRSNSRQVAAGGIGHMLTYRRLAHWLFVLLIGIAVACIACDAGKWLQNSFTTTAKEIGKK